MDSLIEKYKPKHIREILGQKGKDAVVQYIDNYKSAKKKGLLIYGPTGTGKTITAHVIANSQDKELFELNASNFRSKDEIASKLGMALTQASLFGKEKIILLDDIDALSGTKDRGAIPEVLRQMQKSIYPIILTAHDPYDKKLSSLRNKVEMVEYKEIETDDGLKLLKKITKEEKLPIEDNILKTLLRRSSGDLRAAINDLQILGSLKSITKEALNDLGMREREESIIDALLKIFKTTDPKIAITAFDSVEEDLNAQLLWLDENLPKEYEKAEDKARAYDMLSKADIFNRRIRRWQHWRFLVYINALITAGVAVSKDEKYDKFVEYKPTGRILKMWWAKQKSMKKKAIAEKLAVHTHTSTKRCLELIPYYQQIFKKDKTRAEEIAHDLDLDKEQVQWLKK